MKEKDDDGIEISLSNNALLVIYLIGNIGFPTALLFLGRLIKVDMTASAVIVATVVPLLWACILLIGLISNRKEQG